MKKVLLLFLAVIAVTVRGEPPRPVYGPPKGGGGGGSYSVGGGGGEDHSDPANYEFSYEVKDDATGNDFGHMESRMGDVAKGSYHVLLPDGRTQKVDYTADQSGYMPVVQYDGEARPGGGGGGGGGGGSGGGGGGGGGSGGGGGGYRY